MPPHTVSKDLKARIPILFYDQKLNVQTICHLLGVKKTMVYMVLQNHRLYGRTTNPNVRRAGRPRSLSAVDLTFIRAFLAQHHTLYLDELQQALETRCGTCVSVPTLVRTLRRLRYSSKTVSVKALERNDIKRAAFMNWIGAEVPDMDMVIFLDESAKDDRTLGRKMGWSLIGTRCVQRRCFIRGQRYSILPALTLDGIIAYYIIEGPITTKRFMQFLREMVVSNTIFLSDSSEMMDVQYSFHLRICTLDPALLSFLITALSIMEKMYVRWLKKKLVSVLLPPNSSKNGKLTIYHRVQIDIFAAVLTRLQSD